MNLSETARLLGAMAAFDRRTVGDGDVVAWQAILPDAAFEDCLEAVKRYYAEHTSWMMPAHVRRILQDIHGEREAAARATGWAPGQAGVRREDALPEMVPSGKRLALSDLPAEVAALVARVRTDLPEGSREALMPRRVAWEREHAAYRRQQDAEPNPHYRPGAPGRGFDYTPSEVNAMSSADRPVGEVDDAPESPEQCRWCTATTTDMSAHLIERHSG